MLLPAPSLRSRPTDPARVVVTGAGIVTALGAGWSANAEGFRQGRTAFRPVTLFDVSRHRARLAAEVDLPGTLPATALDSRTRARLSRGSRLLILAGAEAWHQSGWEPQEDLPLILGTTSCGMDCGQDYYRQATSGPGARWRQPTRSLGYQAQRQGLDLAEALNFRGPLTILANACASGANALGHAWELIRFGHRPRVLAGGYDALSQLVFAGFDSLQALSPTFCRPFDARRDGLTLGEGAAVLALEDLDHARRRDAEILGEIIGYGATTDLHHLTQPHPEGEAALRVIEDACRQARMTPADVGYVNAHGTGTPLNDTAEASALRRWAGDRCPSLPVSSTKASVGHTLGAAGAVEAVVALMTLREQWLPPQSTVQTVDDACNFDLVRQARAARVEVVLSNSFGFGGATAALLLRRWT